MITFYGQFSGWTSYPSVCRAIANYLDEEGLGLRLCDLRPEGYYDEVGGIPRVPSKVYREVQLRAHYNSRYVGPTEKGTALVFGFPEWLAVVPKHERMVGYHVCDLDRVPGHWVACMNDLADLVLTPSDWCAEVFRACGVKTPVEVVNHGVDSRYFEAEEENLGREPFVVHHYCSAREPARKGTVELVEAWTGAVEPGEHLLRVFSAFPEEHAVLASEAAGVEVVASAARPPAFQACRYAQAHLVAQPSRAEGFGCIPLEARACGTPVLATSCTGHAEHFRGEGIVIVQHGELQPCGQSKGRAPALEVDVLREQLLFGIEHYDRLRAEALSRRRSIEEHWSWRRVLEPLRDLLGS
jgi:glycosyltransferase involved in cell wall biosynthesis